MLIYAFGLASLFLKTSFGLNLRWDLKQKFSTCLVCFRNLIWTRKRDYWNSANDFNILKQFLSQLVLQALKKLLHPFLFFFPPLSSRLATFTSVKIFLCWPFLNFMSNCSCNWQWTLQWRAWYSEFQFQVIKSKDNLRSAFTVLYYVQYQQLEKTQQN
jgi:hypothetical protein